MKLALDADEQLLQNAHIHTHAPVSARTEVNLTRGLQPGRLGRP
jgi:hypothetical protein